MHLHHIFLINEAMCVNIRYLLQEWQNNEINMHKNEISTKENKLNRIENILLLSFL